jgi:hypothetical protein
LSEVFQFSPDASINLNERFPSWVPRWDLEIHLFAEVLDDIYLHLLPTRLVSVAALLRPSHYPRLTLCLGSSVISLSSILLANHNLFTTRFCRAKVINSTRPYLGRLSQLLGIPNWAPL